MTDGRYDSRRGQYEQRSRSNERFDRQPERSGQDERGFFDRARDEVSSWFGDDDVERRRDRDTRDHQGFGSERSYDAYQQNPRYRDEGYRRPYTGRASSGWSGPGENFDRPPSGQNFDRGQSQREFSRFAGGRHDPDYSQWRSRQIEELDRDYEDFRRENQSRFDSEFSTWRGQRQAKRQLLGSVTEHMDVVGSDDLPVGKVDWIKGDKIILTKHDSTDGRHHLISCSMVDRIEDNKVILTQAAEEAKRSFTREGRDPAMFGRDDADRDREDGPHMLNRSFSGTY